MAKPTHPAGLDPEMPAGKGAAKILRAKMTEVAAHAKSALSGDVDGVHDMRIAVKRLREALRLFRRLLPGKDRELTMPLVDQLNDGLGLVRDCDVLMGYAGELAAEAGTGELPGQVLSAWETQRQRLHGELVGLWERLLKRERLMRLLGRLADATAQRKRPLNLVPLDRYAYLAVTAGVERLTEPLAEALASETAETLHRLRIAVKRVKYTMEPFLLILPGIQAPYAIVAQAQEVLGLAHDLDVLESALTEQFHHAGRAEEGAVAEVLARLNSRRQALYGDAHEQVAILASDDWRRQLQDALD